MTESRFLDGRTALVIGGSGGIGLAIARAAASAGAAVAIGSRQATTSSCQADLEAQGCACFCGDVDVRSIDSLRSFHTNVCRELGPIDILVNSAGVCHNHVLSGHCDESWNEVIDVNLNGAYRTIGLCLPGMIERKWGRIINIASDIAEVAVPEYAAYCASKAGLLALTRCAAMEGAPHGVSCNAISPGWVETDMTHRAIESAALAEGASVACYLEKVRRQNPQNRLITTEEIAELAIYLCRDQARGITKQDILVSGGTSW